MTCPTHGDVLCDPLYLDGKPHVKDLERAYTDALKCRDDAFGQLETAATAESRKAAADADAKVVYLNGVAHALLAVVALA